jgi:hypothetical protein
MFAQPPCNPLDITYLNVGLPVDCNSIEGFLTSVEIKAQVSG